MLLESIVIIVGWIVMSVGGCNDYWTVHVTKFIVGAASSGSVFSGAFLPTREEVHGS